MFYAIGFYAKIEQTNHERGYIMALIHCNFYSDTLGVCSSMYVILPEVATTQIGMQTKVFEGKFPTLYLLHGLSDDHTIWLRRTSIERYVASMGIAVVMPAVNRSFYTDMAHGYKYWKYISEEIPAKARSFFPLSSLREDNFVAGLSMGGYGAFKLALRCPEKFCAAASLSGAVNVANSNNRCSADFKLIFDGVDNIKGSENDLFYLAEKIASSDTPSPALFQCCGTEDHLYEGNILFRDHCNKLSLNLTYEEGPGTHEWGYWDANIQRVLKWLPIKSK